MDQIPWWKKTIVYQIYPRSFYDSTGNGIGDLKGIISKLDYIKDLGVETVWFSPFYDSPQKDFGYDIRNYREIALEYGTMEDCERLIMEMHDRGMKIVLDLVLNHTSDQHTWFVQSRSSKDNPKRDWYIWRDGRKPLGKKPPNNWKAIIRGSGWHYDAQTDQWYWTQFLPFQPDLNYRNPEVQTEMLDIVRFWLEKGVDGFRLDIIDALFEDEKFRDNPCSFRLLPSEKSPDYLFQSKKYTQHHPDTLKFLKSLRSVIDEYSPTRFMVGEVTGPMFMLRKYCGDETNDGLNLVFLFKSLGISLNTIKIRRLIQLYESFFSYPHIPTWVFSNHDRMRRISRLGGDIKKAKLNMALQLTVRGVPFIYYGEEIGMENHNLEIETSLDPVAHKFYKVPNFILMAIKKYLGESINRDECRTPMQWNSAQNAGFTKAEIDPWLPITPSYSERNVKIQTENADSLLQCYKRFLKLRNTTPALNSGTIVIINSSELPSNVLSYIRSYSHGSEKQIAVIYLNISDDSLEFKNPHKYANFAESTTVHTRNEKIKNVEIFLFPWEGVVYIA
ncbi:MAG: alpha-glucosidase [Candidatus Lokiarchaeota archaeon]|nr:alpha-glucosidase [Candidatus Lokiarchaeota archaeon]